MSPKAAQAYDALARLREERRDMAGFKHALERYVALRVAQAGDAVLNPPAGWSERRASEALATVQARLKALLGDRPIPETDLIISAAYDGMASTHDAKDWPAFLGAVEAFEKAWRERICRH